MAKFRLPRTILADFVNDLRSASRLDKAFLVFWVMGPVIYLIERTPADIWLSLVGIGFITQAAVSKNWQWARAGWVKLILLFWVIMLVSSALSANPLYALGEAAVWIRFPLYAAACAFWIGTNRARLNMMMMMMALASIVMCAFLGVEFIDVAQNGNEFGGRLGGPYGDLLPGSFLGKAMAPLAVLLSALAISLPMRAAMLPLLAAGGLVFCTIITGERVNGLLICLAVFLAAFAWQFKPKRVALYATLASVLLLGALQNIPALWERYDPSRHQEVSNYFESPYWFSVRPGVVAALENPVLGIGVGMHRLECATMSAGPLWLPGDNECHPHPHQFYVQLAEETGGLGLIAGVAAIVTIIISTLVGTQRSSMYARLAWIPVTLMFFPQPSADFFGQWNNLFLWFAVGLAMAMARDTHTDR